MTSVTATFPTHYERSRPLCLLQLACRCQGIENLTLFDDLSVEVPVLLAPTYNDSSTSHNLRRLSLSSRHGCGLRCQGNRIKQ